VQRLIWDQNVNVHKQVTAHTCYWNWKDVCVSTYEFHLDVENPHHHHTQVYRADPSLGLPEADPCLEYYPAAPVTFR